MTIERRRVIDLSGTTNLLAVHADKQDEGSSNLDPAFNFEGVSELLRSTSSARTCARRNTLADRAYTRMRYALSVGHLVLGKRFRVATVARCLGTGTMPAGHARFQLVQANATHANRRSGVVVRVPMPMEFGELRNARLPLEGLRVSVATPLNLMSGWTGSKCLREMWAFRAAILELGQPILLAMYFGRIRDCIGPIIALMTAAAIRRLRGIASVSETNYREDSVPQRSNEGGAACAMRYSWEWHPLTTLLPTNTRRQRSRAYCWVLIQKNSEACGNSDGQLLEPSARLILLGRLAID